MISLEIVLLIVGIICIIASFLIENETKEKASVETSELSDNDRMKIKEQVEAVIDEQIGTLADRTEAQLDKISNTKILEMNDYAKTVIDEINRNHNETVFLYDMLNEKAKEVKSTVKDVNVAKKEIERVNVNITENFSAVESGKITASSEQWQENYGQEETDDRQSIVNNAGISKDFAKERLIELVKKSNEKTRQEYNEKKYLSDIDEKSIAGTQAVGLVKPIKNDTDVQTHVDDIEKVEVISERLEKLLEGERQVSLRAEKLPEREEMISERLERLPEETISEKQMPAEEKADGVKQLDASLRRDIRAVYDVTATKNEKILALYNAGYSNKEIAKELNLGVGEVKLIIDLHSGIN